MVKVLFQWMDGEILQQFQLEKDTDQYRILMAVVNEVKRSLDGNAAVPAQTVPASNEAHGQPAESSSSPPAVSPLPASVDVANETPAVPRDLRTEQSGNGPPTNARLSVRKSADNQQWAYCDNCKANGERSEYIYGTRFKCAVCDNFDLCEACEASGVHRHHVMLRIGVIVKHVVGWSNALKPLHNELKKFCEKLTPAALKPSEGNQNKNVCNECSVQLTGDRLKCTVCDDFDLCSTCVQKDVHEHHVMMRFAEAIHNVGAWKDMQGSSNLHDRLTAFHDRVIAVKGTPRVGRLSTDISNAAAKAAKETLSNKAPSTAPSRSRRPQGYKRGTSLAAGTPDTTLPKSARISDSQTRGNGAVIKSSNSTGAATAGRNSTQLSRGVRGNAAGALGESRQPLKSEEPAESQTKADQAAAAGSPLTGPSKTETSEGKSD